MKKNPLRRNENKKKVKSKGDTLRKEGKMEYRDGDRKDTGLRRNEEKKK